MFVANSIFILELISFEKKWLIWFENKMKYFIDMYVGGNIELGRLIEYTVEQEIESIYKNK